MTDRICKRCVMPENFPHVSIDSDGICSICRDYKGGAEQRKLKAEYRKRFERLAKSVAGKNEYDVLMCYSGGKDSTYTLSVLRQRYGLNVLAYTLDNGFMPGRTAINIRNVVEALSADHIFFKPRFDVLKAIFREATKRSLYPAKALERAGTICTSCTALVKYSALKTAIEKDIPIVAFGWSPGQAPTTSSVLEINPVMMKEMEKIVKHPMAKIVGRGIEPYFLKQRHYDRPAAFPVFVHPLGFLDYDEKKILEYIKSFGWRRPEGVELNATNCYLNPFADEVHLRQCHFHPYLLEIASLVREGYMSRNQGLRHLPYKKNKKIVDFAKKRLGLR